MADLYDEIVMDHIKNARNFRTLDDADGSAHASNPLCGDELTVYLNLAGDHIEEIGFQCSCCGIAMASASIMTEMVQGKRVGEAMRVLRDIIARLNRPEGEAEDTSAEGLAIVETVRRFPARVNCAVLPWTALRAALPGSAGTDTAPRVP